MILEIVNCANLRFIRATIARMKRTDANLTIGENVSS